MARKQEPGLEALFSRAHKLKAARKPKMPLLAATSAKVIEQLKLFQGELSLREFVEQFNSWGMGMPKRYPLRPENYERVFSYSTVRGWFNGTSKPRIRDTYIIVRKILWVRKARPWRVPEALRGKKTAR